MVDNSVNNRAEIEPKINYYIIGVIFAILSGIRMPFLPEFQLLLIIWCIFHNKGINFSVILLLVTIFCTHHYVVPDHVLRFNSSEYPSIYTKAYGPIKLLDILTLILFLSAIPYFVKRNILKIFYIKGIPVYYLIFSWIGLFFINSQQFADHQALFIIRSYLLFLSIFLFTLNLNKTEYEYLGKLAIFCWTIKMVLAIIIPHHNPLYRSILGLNGIIFFAGDEYLTIPFYMVMLAMIKGAYFNWRKALKIVFLILFLALIAQRKGALPVLIGLLLIIWINAKRIKILGILLKLYFAFSTVFIFLFLYNISDIVHDPLIILAFDEYSNFAHVAIDSLENESKLNPLGFIFGISPFGKYEIINLPFYMDHLMSFGEEVGKIYRYQFWSFPYERCILNIGVLGFVITIIYRVLAIKRNILHCFLIISCIPVCYYFNMTPIYAFALGIIFSFLYNYQNGFKKNIILQ